MMHKKEICYWSEHPDGTKVWYRHEDEEGNWEDQFQPYWIPTDIYIVDNEWAELRKAQADGEVLERFDETTSVWKKSILTYDNLKKDLPSRWHIKSKERVYEWQWIYFDINISRYYISKNSYASKEEAEKNIAGIVKEPYEPSKRERKC